MSKLAQVTLTVNHYRALLFASTVLPHYIIELRAIASHCTDEHDAKALLALVDNLTQVRTRCTDEYDKSKPLGLPRFEYIE